LSAGALLFVSVAANAQYRNDPYYRNGPYGNDPYYRNGPYGNNGSYGRYGGGNGAAASVDRVARDLNMVIRRYAQGDHARNALSELNSFQARASQGRFDTGNLDRAIDYMKPIANSYRLDPQARSMIARDIDILRSVRASGGGYYNQNRGYGSGYPYPGYRY
jgi:hypothetical protein